MLQNLIGDGFSSAILNRAVLLIRDIEDEAIEESDDHSSRHVTQEAAEAGRRGLSGIHLLSVGLIEGPFAHPPLPADEAAAAEGTDDRDEEEQGNRAFHR